MLYPDLGDGEYAGDPGYVKNMRCRLTPKSSIGNIEQFALLITTILEVFVLNDSIPFAVLLHNCLIIFLALVNFFHARFEGNLIFSGDSLPV